MTFKNKSFYVVGLGKSGLSTLHALKKGGAQLWAWDDQTLPEKDLKTMGIPATPPKDAPWHTLDALVLSPGIPHHLPHPHPAALLAQQHTIPILCDVDLFFQSRSQQAFVGITGSNGKSTTTSLTAHLLKAAGIKSEAGGNLGIPAFDIPSLGPKGIHVMELSSFQLERIHTPVLDVAVFLNISPNHLDRHGDMVHYQQAKLHIFDLLKPQGKKIIGVDSPLTDAIYKSLEGPHTIPISGQRLLNTGVYVDQGWLIDHLGPLPQQIIHLPSLPFLKGAHNHQNIAASYAVARLQGNISVETFTHALHTYQGLPHRQEWVGEKDGIIFINDSKATTLEAATKSLGAFFDIYWIVGGEAKEGSVDLPPIRPFFTHIHQVHTMGSSAQAYYDLLKDHIPTQAHTTLPQALKAAWTDAQSRGKKATILLAPACASYDQYKNFEERGDHFRTLVASLLNKKSSGQKKPSSKPKKDSKKC
ncbi:MAG: UDP-N-acetylmuramoyl-L-alanine--D-glutamate ligase [Alphaproteobacteria bacterium]